MKPQGKTPAGSDDEAFCNRDIYKHFRVSKWAILRWRELYGFPQPDFYVGTRAYTWKSTIDAWVATRPRQSALAGKRPPNFDEAERAHQAA